MVCSIDQPQQDPLMTPESTQSNGESLNQNFLHNFLNDSQPSQTNIQPEGSEFMALERLGQGNFTTVSLEYSLLFFPSLFVLTDLCE